MPIWALQIKYQDAHQVHQDPQEVQDVVPIWALHYQGDQDAHQVHQDPQEVQDVVPIGALQIKNFEDEADNAVII